MNTPSLAPPEPSLPIVITPIHKPPINSIVTVHQYKAWWGFGPLANDGKLRTNQVLYIDDQRIDNGVHYRHNLYFLDPKLYPTLPDPFYHDTGRITFFAHTPDFAGVLALLTTGKIVWIQTRNGQVSLLTSEQPIA